MVKQLEIFEMEDGTFELQQGDTIIKIDPKKQTLKQEAELMYGLFKLAGFFARRVAKEVK